MTARSLHPSTAPSPGRLNAVDWMYVIFFGAASLLIALRRGRVPRWRGLLALHACTVPALVLLARRAPRHRVLAFLHDWHPLATATLCFEEVPHFLFALVPGWRDSVLLRLEARLFPVSPAVWLGERGSRPLAELFNFGYFGYYALTPLVGGLLHRRRRLFHALMTDTVAAYIVCWISFVLFPVEGPRHALPPPRTRPPVGWIFSALVAGVQATAGVHGNAFPSAHVAGSVVALGHAWRRDRRLGGCVLAVVVLESFGAVYERYHYASDVIAGWIVGGAVLWRAGVGR